MPLFSVIIPVHNQAKSIREVLLRANAIAIDKELVVVDDGSTDDTVKLLRERSYDNLKVVHHTTSRGLNAAILTGLENSSGEFVIILDSFKLYAQPDYLKLAELVKNNEADIVFGYEPAKGLAKVVTVLLNLLFRTNLHNHITVYKLGRKGIFSALGSKAGGSSLNLDIIRLASKKKLKIEEFSVAKQEGA